MDADRHLRQRRNVQGHGVADERGAGKHRCLLLAAKGQRAQAVGSHRSIACRPAKRGLADHDGLGAISV